MSVPTFEDFDKAPKGRYNNTCFYLNVCYHYLLHTTDLFKKDFDVEKITLKIKTPAPYGFVRVFT
jgi:hypothetical protein